MMSKNFFFLFLLINIFNTGYAISGTIEQQTIQQEMKSLSSVDKTATRVSQAMLPAPYYYLLTQPLMTKGIEEYYQRTPIIQTIYSKRNKRNNTYYRAIRMLIDNSKARNNVKVAQKNKESRVVELAFITMNFSALPKEVITAVLNTNIPFGKLLSANHIQISTKNRNYFSIKCTKTLFSLTHCHLDDKLYGRTNTLVRADNNKWLAHVIEILS